MLLKFKITVFLYFTLIYFKMSFIPLMATLHFQHHYFSFQSHDPSEITLMC